MCITVTIHYMRSVWPVKSRQMSIKVAQKWFHYKNEWFRHLDKNCLKCEQFRQNNCCHSLWKVAQSAINRPIWTRWMWYMDTYLCRGIVQISLCWNWKYVILNETISDINFDSIIINNGKSTSHCFINYFRLFHMTQFKYKLRIA